MKHTIEIQSPAWDKESEWAARNALMGINQVQRDVCRAENRIRMFQEGLLVEDSLMPEIPDLQPLKFNTSYDFIEPLVFVENPDGRGNLEPNPAYASGRYSLRLHSTKGYDQIHFEVAEEIRQVMGVCSQIHRILTFELPQFAPVEFMIVDTQKDHEAKP